MSKHKAIWLALFLLLLATACGGSRDVAEERSRRAETSNGKVVIGVVWPFSETEDMFWKGVQMGVDDVNDAGGVTGRKIQVIWIDDENSVTRGKLIAQDLANDPRVMAVIGHPESSVAIAASAIYQFGELLMLSPGATSVRLTQQDFDLVFRNIPSDTLVAQELADFAAKRGYRRILLISAKDEYGLGLGNTFEQRANEIGITIVDRRSYRVGQSDFAALLAGWETLDADSIFLAGRPPEAAWFVQQVQQMDINAPIAGGTGLFSREFLEIAGPAANGTIVASFFYPDASTPEVKRFKRVFEERYGASPDVWAAQGYDAIRLLADAMNAAGSPAPHQVAQQPHQMRTWTGVTGEHILEENGGISKPIVLNIANGGKFEYFMRTAADENARRVGMVVSPPGITDSGFNQLAWQGLKDAERDFGVFIDFLNTRDDRGFAANINTFIEKQYDLIVTVGFDSAEAVQAAARAHPYQPFAVIDVNFLDEPNVLNSQFAVDEASFLAGYVAASATRSGKIGAYGGVQTPPVEKFLVGFESGIDYYNMLHLADVELLGWSTADRAGLFTGNWDSFEDGQAMAEQLSDQGADVIFPVAGDVGKGTAAVAQERGLLVIGVDTDWYYTVPEYREVYLTSVIKNVNLVSYAAVQALVEGRFEGGLLDFGLTDGGVGLAPFHEQENRVPPLTRLELDGIQKGITNDLISTGWDKYLAVQEETPETSRPAAEEPKEPVTLTLGSWRPDDVAAMGRILDTFHARYPHITVEFTPTNPTEYNDTLRQQLEEGTAPDLFYLRSFATSRQLYEEGYLEPLDDTSTGLSAGLTGLQENFVPQARAPWATDDGVPYGVPFIAVSHGIYYNVDLFEELGLKALPKSWAALLNTAQVIQDAGYIPFANASGDPWAIAEIVFMNLAPNFIGGREGRLAYLSGERCFNDEHTVAAFQAVADIAPFLPPDQATLTYADSLQLFLQGKAAMWMGGSWDIPYFESQAPDFEWSVFAVPAPAGQPEHVTFHLDAGVGLNAASEHKEAARVFLEWLTTYEAAERLGNELPGFFPIHKEVPTFENEHANTFLALTAGRGRDVRWAWEGLLDGSPDGYTLMQDGAVGVINGEMTPREAADALQKGLATWFGPAQACQ